MNNKDLFNAIDKAAEEYVAEVWENTECERPIILRAEKKPRSVKRIVLSTAACAAAVAVIGAGVTVGMKYYSGRKALISGSSGSLAPGSASDNIERNFAPAAEILRIRDVGFYTENMSSVYRIEAEEWYSHTYTKEFFEKSIEMDYAPPQPDVYYYNDIPLDRRMLSNEAYSFLSVYCLLSEEDRADETVPDEVKYLTGGGIIRYGDLGFLEDKYTEQQLEHFKAYCASPLVFSSFPPEPDVYYYDDIPYHLDRVWSDDARNWLKWFCWLDEGTQEQLSGYVPEEMTGIIRACNSEKPQEIVTYKGRALDVRGVDYDTEKYIKWYNSLSAELKSMVRYAPEELSEENLDRYPVVEPDVNIIGPDGVPLTYKELYSEQTVIYKIENVPKEEGEIAGYRELSSDEIEQWDEIRCGGFVYLAEPGSDEFKRYNVGDEINGLKVTYASTLFRRFEGVSDPALYYAGGEVMFEGTAKVDILAVENDTFSKCAISGLPVIDVDEKARAEGKIVPQQHSADEFANDPDALLNEDSHCFYGGITGFGGKQLGQIQRGVEIEEISLNWQYDYDNIKHYSVVATLPKAPDGEKSPSGTSSNADNEGKSPSGTAPNAHLSTRSVSFSEAKEQVEFVDVKNPADADLVGHDLEYIMPSETLLALKYVYVDGEVSVMDNSGDTKWVEISSKWYEKIEQRGDMVFWRSLLHEKPTVVYVSESDVAYIASFESDEDLSKGIEKIISLL